MTGASFFLVCPVVAQFIGLFEAIGPQKAPDESGNYNMPKNFESKRVVRACGAVP